MIPHNLPTIGIEEEDAALRVIRSKQLSQDKEVKLFENEFIFNIDINAYNTAWGSKHQRVADKTNAKIRFARGKQTLDAITDNAMTIMNDKSPTHYKFYEKTGLQSYAIDITFASKGIIDSNWYWTPHTCISMSDH